MKTTNRTKALFRARTLALCLACGCLSAEAQPQSGAGEASPEAKTFEVIAHRGYWDTEGSAQNSRASLRKALELGIYGSETDVWLTADGQLMVNHDRTFDGVEIKSSTAKECKKLTLKNGETMPTLRDLLKIVKKSKSRTKLIIEIKGHGDEEADRRAASATVRLVKKMRLEDRVEYISFSDIACEQIISDDPNARVAALTGGKSPAMRKARKYSGIDYNIKALRDNPGWISEAHSLGMTVNVWTVNAEDAMKEMARKGVDYITTDKPTAAMALRQGVRNPR